MEFRRVLFRSYVQKRPLPMNDRALALLTPEARSLLSRVVDRFVLLTDWTEAALEEAVRGIAEAEGLKLGKVAQPLRAALTGSNVSPGVFEVAEIGRGTCRGRVGQYVKDS